MYVSQVPQTPRARIVRVADPGAGLNFSRVNDSGRWWVIHTLLFTYTTDANVANRSVQVDVSGGDDRMFRVNCQRVQAAGATREYMAFDGSTHTETDDQVHQLAWPTHGLRVRPGHTISSIVINIQVGDVLAGIRMDVWEYPERYSGIFAPASVTYLPLEGV